MSKFDEIRMPPKSKDDFYIFPDLREEAKPMRTWLLMCYLVKDAQNTKDVYAWLDISHTRIQKIMLFTVTQWKTAVRNLENLGWVEVEKRGVPKILQCRIKKSFYDKHLYTLQKQP